MHRRDAALLDAAQAAASPALFAITLLQHIEVPVLTPMHTLPRWLAGAWVVVWLCMTLLLARVESGRMRWVLALHASALAAAVAALLALARGGWTAGALGWAVIAAMLIGLGLLVSTWRTRPTRSSTRPPVPRSLPRPPRTWTGAIGYAVCAALFIDGFWRSLAPPGEERGAGMLLMLIAFFVLLPAAAVATWYPRTARVGWIIGAAAAAAVVLLVDTPSVGGLLATAIAFAFSCRPLPHPVRAAAPREGLVCDGRGD
jgi:hypothetical protein